MKIHLNNLDVQKAKELLDTSAWNIDISEFLNDEIIGNQNLLNDSRFITFRKAAPGSLIKIPEFCYDFEEADCSKHIDSIKVLDVKEWSENPYANLLKTISIKKGRYFLGMDKYQPLEPFLLGEIEGNKKTSFVEKNPLGMFQEPFSFLVLKDGDTPWMSLTPHEIETMKPAIEASKGKVLVYGLGLGYFAFMAARKENVSHVTVIENNQTIIDLYNEKILPSLPCKNKISIIKADAFEFAKNETNESHFDYVFFDIYHNEQDGLPLYLSFLKVASPYTNNFFWVEKTMLTFFRRIVIELFAEEAEGVFQNEDDGDSISKIFSKLHTHLLDNEINSYEELENLLSDESLKNIAKSLNF